MSNFHAILRLLKSHSYFSKLNDEFCLYTQIIFFYTPCRSIESTRLLRPCEVTISPTTAYGSNTCIF